jgi:hypothetical protein
MKGNILLSPDTQVQTPPMNALVPPVSASSVQINKFPYKFCLCTAYTEHPLITGNLVE